VRTPTQRLLAVLVADLDMLFADLVGVVSTGSDVQQQFERQPHRGAKGVVLAILFDLRFQPGHVALRLETPFKFDTFRRVIGAQLRCDGPLRQPANC